MLKTMVAHTTIDNNGTYILAKTNAYVNVCMSNNLIDRQQAIQFSLAAAQFLDFVVFDNDFYKLQYEYSLKEAYESSKASRISGDCAALARNLPTMTEHIQTTHYASAQRVAAMRAEENRQIAQSLSSIRPVSDPTYQVTFPKLDYAREQPKTQSYLIDTKGGLTQCMVTSSNFVFCL